MAIVNDWLLYRKDCNFQNIKKQGQLDLLGFRCEIAETLCKEGKATERKRGPTFN